MDKFYWDSFKTFFKIGASTLSGGHALIPIIESEVVEKREWMEKNQFLDLIAICQSCPGIFAINISILIGYKLRNTRGALCTAIGAALPAFLIFLLIVLLFRNLIYVSWIAAMFNGIRPAVVALIAIPTFNMAKSAKINLVNCWIPVGSALLIWAMGVNPIYIIIAAGIGGYLYGKFLTPTEE